MQLQVAPLCAGIGAVIAAMLSAAETGRIGARSMLEIDGLSVSYGGLAALRGVSLTVEEGQFVAIVGPNGAGKTTLFKAISGTVAPVSGSILFEGRDLLAVPPPERAHLGIAH